MIEILIKKKVPHLLYLPIPKGQYIVHHMRPYRQEIYNFRTKFGHYFHSVFSKLVYNKEKFLQIQMMIYSHISWENAMVLLLQMPDDNWFYCYLNGKRAITKVIYHKHYNKICLGFSLFWPIKIKIIHTLKAMYRNSNIVVILPI